MRPRSRGPIAPPIKSPLGMREGAEEGVGICPDAPGTLPPAGAARRQAICMGGRRGGEDGPNVTGFSLGYPKKEANPAPACHAVAAMQQDGKTTVQLSSHNR
ncbi:hypothetical protein SKB0092_20820 [Roseomonas mucosa]